MKEKDIREKLTRDKIKLDLIDRAKPVPVIIIVPLVLLMIAFFGLTIYKLSTDEMSKMKLYISIALVALLAIACLALFPYLIYQRHKISRQKKMAQNGGFEVVQDTLAVAGAVARYKEGVREKFNFFDCFIYDRHKYQIWFQFAKYGDCYLPFGKSYKWSDRYCMSDEGVQNTSLVGDTFYIVIYRNDEKKEPVMFYNTKLFEYEEDELY